MDDHSCKLEKIVTLRLKGHDIPINREKLSEVSKYFAALFSHRFKDSMEKVHVINYEINLTTLRTFADWIQDKEVEKRPCSVKSSLAAVSSNDIVELLELLKLSVLYAVDQLTDEIVGIVAAKRLQPGRVIRIWLLAQELSVNVLRDLCIATCLDRFEELPEKCLLQLSKENIQQLMENKCIRASHSYVSQISMKWSQYHADSLIIRPKHTQSPTFLRCTVGYKIDKFANKKAYIYCWDGTKFFELLELKDCEKGCTMKEIVGMQATGRGFSIYVIGGERGFGSGDFNMEIWRYCLISQQWYYQARLPVARRHMVTVFLDNKLAVVGGVGRLRLKLNSVDILDIHRGYWKKAARVPEEFTEVPLHCVMKGKLFLLKSFVHIYDPKIDFWQTIKLPSRSPAFRADAFTEYGKTLFFTYSDDCMNEKTMLFRVDSVRTSMCSVNECSKASHEHVITDNLAIVSVDNEWYQLRFASLTGMNILFIETENSPCNRAYLTMHDDKINDLNGNFINTKLGCFDLINQNVLYGQVVKNE